MEREGTAYLSLLKRYGRDCDLQPDLKSFPQLLRVVRGGQLTPLDGGVGRLRKKYALLPLVFYLQFARQPFFPLFRLPACRLEEGPSGYHREGPPDCRWDYGARGQVMQATVEGSRRIPELRNQQVDRHKHKSDVRPAA